MDNFAYQQEERNDQPIAIARYASAQVGPNDYLVEVNSRSKIFKKPTFYKRISLGLLILAVLLMIGLITIMVLYFQRRNNPKICTSNECLRSATNLLYSMDTSVDPCEDFYQYTCGKWSTEHLNHGWFYGFSNFDSIREKMSIEIRDFFLSEPKDDEHSAVVKSRSFYASCMNSEAMDQIGLTVVYKYLNEVDLPIIPNYFSLKTEDERKDFKFDWLKREASIKKTFYMDVFMGFLVEPNIFNRTQNVMYIRSKKLFGRLPTPFRKNVKHRTNTKIKDAERNMKHFQTLEELNEKKINMVQFVVKTIAPNCSIEMPSDELLLEASHKILDILDFLDELNTNYTFVNDHEIAHFTFKEFQNITDNYLMQSSLSYPNIWEKFIGYLFDGSDVTIDFKIDHLYIYVKEKMYLQRILKYVLGTPEIDLELYMWWVTVDAMIINTSSDIIEFFNKQTEAYYGPSEIVKSQAVKCSSLVTQYMGLAVSYALIDKNVEQMAKLKVKKIITAIKDSFVNHVKMMDWLDSGTKARILEKNKEMISFIGYPEWLFDNFTLKEFYEYKDMEIHPDTYLENMMTFIKLMLPSELDGYRDIVERSWSYESPVDVDAFNSFPDNAINIPIGMINFPMYHLGLEVLNYGSIGSIVGHELTHGFDDSGRYYDEYGNYLQWWSNNTEEIFEELTQCFIDQYNNFTIDGTDVHVDGEQTLGENIADNGGLHQAYAAYMRFSNRKGEEPKLPGLETYTSEQLFFIAFASIWCETIDVEGLLEQVQTDEHSPHYVRVLGTLQNSVDFSRAFNCPRGSTMNPTKKCRIW